MSTAAYLDSLYTAVADEAYPHLHAALGPAQHQPSPALRQVVRLLASGWRLEHLESTLARAAQDVPDDEQRPPGQRADEAMRDKGSGDGVAPGVRPGSGRSASPPPGTDRDPAPASEGPAPGIVPQAPAQALQVLHTYAHLGPEEVEAWRGAFGGDLLALADPSVVAAVDVWRSAVPGALAPVCAAAGLDPVEAAAMHASGALDLSQPDLAAALSTLLSQP